MSNGIGDYTKYIVGDEGFLIDTSNPGSAALDLGITALALTGVGAIPAAILKAGVKGKKAKKLIDQAKKKSKDRLSNAAAADVMTSLGEVAGEEIMGVEGMAKGGLADLPVQHAIFGKLIKAGKEFVKGQKKKGGKKDTKKDTEKDTKTDTKTDKEKPLLISPGSDLKRVRDVATAILASEGARKTLRGAQRLGLYGGVPAVTYLTGKALLGEDEEETAPPPPSIGDPIEPKTFLEKLRDMDPALARALIAGGAKMLQPTEGPARSFLGLGEFGEGFSESLAQSEAGKSDTQQLYEAYLASVPEGQAPLDIVRFANSLKQDSDDFRNQESRLLTYLQNNANVGSSYTLSDFAVEKKDLSAIGIDYQGEKDPSVDELLIRYSGPERESVINLIVSKSYVKD